VRILFDQGTPAPLREALTQHEVSTPYERGGSKLRNGELLDAAEREGFALRVTTGSNLRYQQNLGHRCLVLSSTSWPRIQRAIAPVVVAARQSVDKYAYLATPSEIAENDYNLNIPRYVDTFEEEEEIDLKAVRAEREKLKAELAKLEEEMAVYLKEPGYE